MKSTWQEKLILSVSEGRWLFMDQLGVRHSLCGGNDNHCHNTNLHQEASEGLMSETTLRLKEHVGPG